MTGGAQHPPTTPNRHVFPQSDFRGHGKSQFHHRPFRERRLGVKENSTAAQVLSKPGHRPSLEVNRQREVQFETLRASAFQIMFQTIRICVHKYILPVSGALRIGGSLLYRGSNPRGSSKSVAVPVEIC
jgi:hypothetical protein